jgi:hypothetical protein
MTVIMSKPQRDDLAKYLTGLEHSSILFEVRGATPVRTTTSRTHLDSFPPDGGRRAVAPRLDHIPRQPRGNTNFTGAPNAHEWNVMSR